MDKKLLYRLKQNHGLLLPYVRIKDHEWNAYILNRRYVPIFKLVDYKPQLLPVDGSEQRIIDGPHWVSNVVDKSYYYGSGSTPLKFWDDDPERLLEVLAVGLQYAEAVPPDEVVRSNPFPPLEKGMRQVGQWVFDCHEAIKRQERSIYSNTHGGRFV